jgi:sugar/nucleoside kinase (ribokinase family)
VSLGVNLLDILGAPVADEPGHGINHLVDDVRITAAGTAAGTSVDLAKLGAEVVAMGAIGIDEIGDLLVTRLRMHGVETDHLVRKESGTATSILPIREDGERFAVFHRPGAYRQLTLEDVDREVVASADLLHVGGPDVLGDFAQEPLAELLREARDRGVITTMDVLGDCDAETLARLTHLLALTDYFFPNHHQLGGMTGTADPIAGAEAILALGAGCVVVTRGADGSLVVTGEKAVELPAFDVEIVDTTGCGDAYTAGFIVGTLKGWSLRSRGLLGSACAALVAGGLGSDAGIDDLESTLALVAELAPDGLEELTR